MGVLWKKHEGPNRYEVRNAGETVRLYRNGAFHTQFNPTRSTTAGVWDLLTFSAFFGPLEQVKRVLVLGVGGGAVIRMLQRYVPRAELVGVDLDRWHLYVAERFFGVRGQGVELVHSDARAWVTENYRCRFDLIIDDLFGEQKDDAERAIPATEEWMTRLQSMLRPGGTLAINFASRRELRSSGYGGSASVRQRFADAFSLARADEYNVVGIFLTRRSSPKQFRRRLRSTPGLDPRVAKNRVAFQLRRLSER